MGRIAGAIAPPPKPMAFADIEPNFDVNGAIAQQVPISFVRADSGWSFTAFTMDFNGAPDRVRVEMVCAAQNPGPAPAANASPEIYLERDNGGGFFVVARGQTNHIAGAGTGNNRASITIAFTDPQPGNDPRYRLLAVQGNILSTDPILVQQGHFSCEAEFAI